MDNLDISSVSNPKIKRLKKLLDSSSKRKEAGQFIVETPRFIQAILEKEPDLVDSVFLSLDFEGELLSYLHDIVQLYTVKPILLDRVTLLRKSSGVVAVFNKPHYDIESLLPDFKRICICDAVQTPSNIGAIIRNAAAFDIDAIFLTEGCADVYHPEAIRAMAGHCVHVPVFELDETLFTSLTDSGFTFYDCDPHSDTSINDISFSEKSCFILGSEGQGLVSSYLQNYPNKVSLTIPMSEHVESLNVAVSSGIIFNCLYSN